MVDQNEMEKIVTPMMEHICDHLCKHPGDTKRLGCEVPPHIACACACAGHMRAYVFAS